MIGKNESPRILTSSVRKTKSSPHSAYWCHSVLQPVADQVFFFFFCILRHCSIKKKKARGGKTSSGTQPTSERRTDWYLHYTLRNQWRQPVSPDPTITSPSRFAGLQHSLPWSTWGLCSILPHCNWLVFPSEMSHPALPQNGTSTCNRQAMSKGTAYHPQPGLRPCSQEKWNLFFKL